MEKYVSHFSAAYKWNIPYVKEVFGKEYNKKYLEEKTVEYTVFEQAKRTNHKGYVTHSCGQSLPKGAIIRHKDYLIASPELVFLELANTLDFHRLVLLGLQMCSHEVGNESESITTKRKLETFINKTTGFNGNPNAVRALNHIADGSSSILESIIYMLLTLPNKHGGYGLTGACFNHEVLLRKEAAKRLKQQKCYIDFYYPKVKIAIEYDSLKYHRNATSQGKDQLRATALSRQGIRVFSLKPIQLYNRDSFEEFVQNLALRLGKRIRIRSKNFESNHRKLRKLLPKQD